MSEFIFSEKDKKISKKNSCRKIDRTDSSRTVDRKLAWPPLSKIASADLLLMYRLVVQIDLISFILIK